MNGNSPSEVSRLLQAYFCKPSSPTRRAVARNMGMVEITFDKKISGENPLSDTEFIAVFNNCRLLDGEGPIDALRYVVSECDPNLTVTRIAPATPPDGDINGDLRRISIEIGKLNATIDTLSADGLIDRSDKEIIRKRADALKAECDSLMAELVKGPALTVTAIGIHVQRMQK